MYNKSAPTRPIPANAATGARTSTNPVASLSIGIKNGESMDFHDLTGLFDATDKKGNSYFRVSVKEELYIPKGASIFLRPNAGGTTPKASLSYGVSKGVGTPMTFTDVIELDTAADKSGKNYFKGSAGGDLVIPAGSLLFARPKTANARR